MKLSVIIPCLNAVGTLGAQLEAFVRQQWPEPWELIVADNGSTDGSAELAKTFSSRIPRLNVIDASRRRGSGAACNLGVQCATGLSVAFTDADDVVDDAWVKAMGNALSTHRFVACRTDASRFNKPGLRLSPQQNGLQKLWYPPWLPHAGGGTIGLRRSLFDELRGFDESLPYLQDTEFCIRAQFHGAPLHYVPEAVLHLRNRAGFGGHYRQARNWGEYNSVLAKRYWPKDSSTAICWREYAREWCRLAWMFRFIAHPSAKYEVAWRLGWQVGRLKGAVKHAGIPV